MTETTLPPPPNFPPSMTVQGIEYKKHRSQLVYGWRRLDEYLYIGMSNVGISRVYAHNVIDVREKFLITDCIDIWYCDNARELECKLIETFNPIYNIARFKYKEKKELIKSCVTCGTTFKPKKNWQIHCSSTCSNKRSYRDEDTPKSKFISKIKKIITKDGNSITVNTKKIKELTEEEKEKLRIKLANKIGISIEQLKELEIKAKSI